MLGELVEIVSLVHGASALGAGYGIGQDAAVRRS
jgi:hypothetical protein